LRRKVYGRTKQDVRDKLKALHQELDAAIRSPAEYTVRDAVQDWLREGLDGRSQADPCAVRGPAGADIGDRCVEALREHRQLQAEDRMRAGALWQDHGLVFSSTVGTPLSANNVIRAFRTAPEKARLGRIGHHGR
jgi:hypothetical protein